MGNQEDVAPEVVRASFPRTLRILALSAMRRQAGMIVVATLLFGGWLFWLVAGRVPIYVVSQQSRFETRLLPVAVDVPIDGVIDTCQLELSKPVTSGAVLFRLDVHPFELQRNELQAQVRADDAAIGALTGQIDVETKWRDAISDLARKTTVVGEARLAASRTSFDFKRRESDIVNRLHEGQLASGLDNLKAQEDVQSQHAQANITAAQALLDNVSSEANVRDHDMRLAALRKALSDSQAQKDLHAAHLATIEYEIERRTVRAIVDGRLVDIMPCTIGMAVQQGQKLATLLPDSEVHVVSFFHPEDAVGRLNVGQTATLRVDNFPWTQFGTLTATVERVGAEPRDNLVRVELRIDGKNPSIPIAHGLTGTTEVEVERISPLQILLRGAGRYVTPSPSVAPSATEAQPRAAR